MGRIQELISRRYNFAGLYATIALAAGLCDVFFLLLGGFTPLQLIAPAIAKSIADGSLFTYDSGGTALTGSSVVFYAVSIAPFFLIYLALVRGRRIGRRSLVVFPILGTAVVLVGGLPFIATNFANARFLSKLIAWLFDGVCLYHGALRKTDQQER